MIEIKSSTNDRKRIKFRSVFIKMFIFHSILSWHRPCVCLLNKDITLRFIDKSYQSILCSKNRKLYLRVWMYFKVLPLSYLFTHFLFLKKRIYFVTSKKEKKKNNVILKKIFWIDFRLTYQYFIWIHFLDWMFLWIINPKIYLNPLCEML